MSPGFKQIETIMREVGGHLATIRSFTFQESGFFDRNLNTTGILTQADLLKHAQESLNNQTVKAILSATIIDRITFHLNNFRKFFPSDSEQENNLVHADFDPANILVDYKENGTWQVSAILDWEFAFSGSSLWDVANMLRYAHEMPPAFKNGFLRGLQKSGYDLPSSWQASVHLLNLLSLLDCLARTDAKSCPHQSADIKNLIQYICEQLERK